MNKTILTFVILLLFISCKKEKIIPAYCSEFLQSVPESNLTINCPTGLTTLQDEDSYEARYPVFNPLNPNEIIFLLKDSPFNSLDWKLIRFNICNGKKTEIGESRHNAPLDWNIKNWILFSNNYDSRKVYKIKGNKKDSLALSNITDSKILKWNQEGTKFMARKNFQNINYIFDENGQLLQQISDLPIEEMDWKGNQIAIGSYPNLKVIDLQTMVETQIAYDNSSIKFSVHFFKENHILWNTNNIIAYTNIETKETIIIKEAKPGEVFSHLDLSIDEKKLVVKKLQQIVIDNCTTKQYEYLAIMDIDGLNEKRILLPD